MTLLCSGAPWALGGQGSLKADQGTLSPYLRVRSLLPTLSTSSFHPFQPGLKVGWILTGEEPPPAHRVLSIFFCILSGSLLAGGHRCPSLETGADQSLEEQKSVVCPGSARFWSPSRASSPAPPSSLIPSAGDLVGPSGGVCGPEWGPVSLAGSPQGLVL